MSQLDDTIRACTRCSLRATCNEPVPGDGNFSARILVVGEAPGADEDREHRPFVGRSGKLLTSIFESVGLTRDRDYYITNIVKCRPPNNRDPEVSEIAACSPYLIDQIEAMRPTLIVTLGRFSFGFFVPEKGMTASRGQCFRIHEVAGIPLSYSPTVLASFHPAVALYDPRKRDTITEDLARIPDILHTLDLQ